MNVVQLSSATSGTITAVNTQQNIILVHDAGATLTLTIAFPANPVDGQQFVITSAGSRIRNGIK